MAFGLDANLAELSGEQARIAMAAAIAVGVLYCFLGYRLFKLVLVLTGFVLAGSVAGALTGFLSHGKLVYMAAAACLGGVAGAFALSFLYKAGVFCVGVLAGVLVADALIGARPETWVTSAVVGAAVFGGLAALAFERPMMTVATAAIGAWVAAQGVTFFVLGAPAPDGAPRLIEDARGPWIVLTCWAMLATAGIAVQIFTHERAANPTAGA